MPEIIEPADTLFSAKIKIGDGDPPRELLRLTADGRTFAFTDDGAAWEIDSQALFEALRAFRQN